MRYALMILMLIPLCSACDNVAGKRADTRAAWFTTYQSDRTCQNNRHLRADDPFEKGPTGRTHPF